MFSSLLRQQARSKLGAPALRARGLATVTETSERALPFARPVRATPSRERATLTLKNGPVLHGYSYGASNTVSGEVVFTTSLTGYPESLSDPSYRGQMLCFTQPLIGNYGVPAAVRDEFGLLKYFESQHLQPLAVICGDVAVDYSHWTAVESLAQWTSRQGVPLVSGIDTRRLVTHLREQGTTLAKITIGEEYDQDEDEAFVDPEQINLVRRVSTKAPFHIPAPNPQAHVAVIDCGVKENILRSLVSRGMSITVLPFDYPIHKVAHHFDGVFISNGPGDPTHCQDTVYHLRELMDNSQIPIFGICLGHQLVALAAGAKTVKMKYGNRAHNIPVLDLTTNKCQIRDQSLSGFFSSLSNMRGHNNASKYQLSDEEENSSQNHGYAVDASTLPPDFKPYFINLNDKSNEGIIHKTRPIFSTQFHPEASAGPLDHMHLFDVYRVNVLKYKESQAAASPYRESTPSPLLVDLLPRDRVGVELPDGIKSMMAANNQSAQGHMHIAGTA